MKQVDIRSIIIPNRPRSGNYPTGTTVIPGGGGSNSTIINQGGGIDLSQARKEFLSKKTNDEANGYINFLKGIGLFSNRINKYLKHDGIDIDGYSDEHIMSALFAITHLLRKDAPDETNYLLKLLGGLVTDDITSTSYIPGPMGTGFKAGIDTDGSSFAQFDKLLVRKKAIFQMLSIMKTEAAGSNLLLNASGARIEITKVEMISEIPVFYSDGRAKYYSDGSRAYVKAGKYGSVYRCYFLADDGDTAIQNMFKPGNFARSQIFDIKEGAYENVSNKYYWRYVENVGDNYIDLSIDYCAENSDVPSVGDVVVQLGDVSDADYQTAIILNSYGSGSPSITLYQGINSFSLDGKDIFTIGYDPAKKRCYLKNFGDAYIGARDGSSYLNFDDVEGLLLKLKKFSADIISGTQIVADSFQFTTGEDVGLKITNDISLKLKDTGIDIEEGVVTITADDFRVKDTSGNPIVVFELVDGKPCIRSELIKVTSITAGNVNVQSERGNIVISPDNGTLSFVTKDNKTVLETYFYSNGVRLDAIDYNGGTKTSIASLMGSALFIDSLTANKGLRLYSNGITFMDGGTEYSGITGTYTVGFSGGGGAVKFGTIKIKNGIIYNVSV